MNSKEDTLAKAITGGLISPNVADSNLEPANVVDAIALVASAIDGHAEALRELAQVIRESRQAATST